MLRLIVREPGLERELEFDADEVTVGSAAENSVIITDPTALPAHCLLQKTREGWRITNLGSKAGTMLDGVPVRRFSLGPGSVISIGRTRIHVSYVVPQLEETLQEKEPPAPSKRTFRPESPRKAVIRKALAVAGACAVGVAILWLTSLVAFDTIIYYQPEHIFILRSRRERAHQPFDQTAGTVPAAQRKTVLKEPDLPDDDLAYLSRWVPCGISFNMMAYDKKAMHGLNLTAPWHGGVTAGALGRRPRREAWPGRRVVPRDVQRSINAALDWLARHQDPDGKWDQDGFDKNCDPDDKCGHTGTSQYDVGVTSLAMLAFLGSGSTHHYGRHSRTIRRGLDWLLSQQNEDGSLGPRLAESWVYNHAIGTLVLCEAYAATRDYHIKQECQKAVDFILAAQNPGLGWKYEPRSGRSDTSVTGWMVLALTSACKARLEVPKSVFQGAVNWLDRMTITEGRVGYMKPGDKGSVIRGLCEVWEKLPVMTAVAIICRIFCGQSRRDPKITKGVDIIMAHLPDWNSPRRDKINMYYWFWGTRAMYQYGGKKWHTWGEALKRALLRNQRTEGCASGSWDPYGQWGMVGGRVYSTALCCMTLQAAHFETRVSHRPRRY